MTFGNMSIVLICSDLIQIVLAGRLEKVLEHTDINGNFHIRPYFMGIFPYIGLKNRNNNNLSLFILLSYFLGHFLGCYTFNMSVHLWGYWMDVHQSSAGYQCLDRQLRQNITWLEVFWHVLICFDCPHPYAPWCWNIYRTKTGPYIWVNVGVHIPAPWFASGSAVIQIFRFRPHAVMAPNTSYKYWTNPINRMYNPTEITSYTLW